MKIELENGKIVLSAENWKALTEKEHEYLHKCYAYGMWVDFTPSGKLKFREYEKAKYQVELIRIMFSLAEAANVAHEEEVETVYNQLREKALEELLLEERKAFLEQKRRTWECRERTGCEGCRDCERIGDGWFRCLYSGDDLEARFSEVWDPVSRCMIIFHEVGVPNAHCKDYYQERKEFGR